jgi:hypothetical protein
MTPRLVWYVGRQCGLASLAYAAHMKRLGNSYFFGAVAALCSSIDEPEVLYGGPLPSRLRGRLHGASGSW